MRSLLAIEGSVDLLLQRVVSADHVELGRPRPAWPVVSLEILALSTAHVLAALLAGRLCGGLHLNHRLLGRDGFGRKLREADLDETLTELVRQGPLLGLLGRLERHDALQGGSEAILVSTGARGARGGVPELLIGAPLDTESEGDVRRSDLHRSPSRRFAIDVVRRRVWAEASDNEIAHLGLGEVESRCRAHVLAQEASDRNEEEHLVLVLRVRVDEPDEANPLQAFVHASVAKVASRQPA